MSDESLQKKDAAKADEHIAMGRVPGSVERELKRARAAMNLWRIVAIILATGWTVALYSLHHCY